MIHIVFSDEDAATLQAALELDESLNGKIVVLPDNLSVGPLQNIYQSDGIELRKEWWSKVLQGGDFVNLIEKGKTDNNAAITEVINLMNENENETVWIWAAQNARDVSGYYWSLQFVKPYQGRVFILYLNNLPFINEKGGIFYPVKLSEILPTEFLKAKKLARPITLSEFELDPDEWQKLMAEQKGIRLLEGGKKLIQADYDYYDSGIKKYVTTEWIKPSRLVSQFLQKGTNTIGEAYTLWRIKEMITAGFLDIQGKVANMKDFEIKTKDKETAEAVKSE